MVRGGLSGRGKRDLAIKAPPSDRLPPKTNCYTHARAAPTARSPLFPYFAPACMVPGSVKTGTHGGLRGLFVHRNTAHEVNPCTGLSGGYPIPRMVRAESGVPTAK
jgi:hypothetical protein